MLNCWSLNNALFSLLYSKDVFHLRYSVTDFPMWVLKQSLCKASYLSDIVVDFIVSEGHICTRLNYNESGFPGIYLKTNTYASPSECYLEIFLRKNRCKNESTYMYILKQSDRNNGQ